MKAEKFQKNLAKAGSSVASLVKVAVMSKGMSSGKPIDRKKEIVVMGNGPSLRTTIDEDSDWLLSHDLMSVNFAPNTPDFSRLRPQHHILADGHFFSGNDTDPNVMRMWGALNRVSWEMTLWVPIKYYPYAKAFMGGNDNVTVSTFNLTPIEGSRKVSHMLFDVGLGMPRPRNVLIPAIMVAIREGYGTIWLCGADHTWTQTLSVDDDNFVVSVQPHFYKDNDAERARVRSAYTGLHLHDVLGSMTVAFRSYWEIAEYAKKRGVKIINATPGSMIDAFERRK